MISNEHFECIRNKYGKVASWAIWEACGDRPKSNMSACSVFDLNLNPTLLETIQTQVIMCGLNFSRGVTSVYDFANFHDESPHANDFKIRYAFEDTPYYGAYMTDALKNLVIPNAQNVREYLKRNPKATKPHMELLEQELADLATANPLILAFGRDAFAILSKSLKRDLYGHLIQVTHYSHQISKEKYRVEVLSQIEIAINKRKHIAEDAFPKA
jgi:hypothetical protein